MVPINTQITNFCLLCLLSSKFVVKYSYIIIRSVLSIFCYFVMSQDYVTVKSMVLLSVSFS